MTITRRRLLGLMAALPLLSACDWFNRKFKGLNMQPISAEEIELLKKPLTRPAYFAAKGLPQGTLVIRDRVFGEERSLLRNADIKDVRFFNCSFEMMQGYGNNLEDVVFEECQFLGGNFTGDLWKNAKFVRCYAEGPFKIGCVDGDIVFEECTMRGLTSEEGGRLGGWSAHFGVATATDGSISFLRCKLTNVGAGGKKSFQMIDCDIHDLEGGTRSKKGILHIEKCRAKGKVDLGISGANFSRITIKDSQLGLVNLMGASSDVVEILNSSMNMKMGAVGTHFKRVHLCKSRFSGEGFRCVLSTFGDFEMDACEFAQGAILELAGQYNDQRGPGEPQIYWTRTRALTIRNMVVPKAQMAYMQIGTLTLENATLKDADMPLCCIDTIQFKNARLEGDLNLSETTIRRIENNGLVNQAKIKGKLEANPDAPKPELEAPKPIEDKKEMTSKK